MSKTSPNPCRTVMGGDSNIFYPSVSQRVVITGTSNRSSELSAYTLDLIPTVDCFFEIGDVTVVATTLDHFLKSNIRKTIHVKEDTYIAVKNATSGETGSLYISEMI
jgi:hypothetical protein